MKIIKATSRKVVGMKTYNGVCDYCGCNLEYDGDMIVVIVEETSEKDIVVPVDVIYCPSCEKRIQSMNIYKSLDVTGEMSQVVKKLCPHLPSDHDYVCALCGQEVKKYER